MSKRVRPKVRGKKDVFDEYEYADIDRDEQKEGLKRRERRWKEIELEEIRQKKLEQYVIKNAEKMKQPPQTRQPNDIEEAWLRCDYVLYNIMQPEAYEMMEWARLNEPEAYKYLYRKFMSQNMMHNIMYYVNYFAQGKKSPTTISTKDVQYHYAKYKGYKPTITIQHKGKKKRGIGEEEEDV